MSIPEDLQPIVGRAIERGIDAYIESRLTRIPAFVDRHFSVRGAWALQRKTYLRDSYRLPFNLLVTPPVFLLHQVGSALRKLGADQLGRRLESVPSGLPTALQEELRWLIYSELLELPYAQNGRISTKDALLEAILSDQEVAELCKTCLDQLAIGARRPEFAAKLERHFGEYGKTRLAVSELSGGLLTLISGYAALHQATPGILSGGSAAAGVIAQHVAISNFWLGSTLGGWYYGLFPATASAGLVLASTGVLMALIGPLVALTWIAVDPLLAKTGLHRRRLRRFVCAVGNALRGEDSASYRVRDHYAARVLDVLDILRSAAQAIQ